MAAIAGKGGKATIGANTIAEIDEWTYTPSADLLEKTKFLDNSKSHVKGLMDGTVTFKGRHDMTDTNGQVALRNAYVAGTQVSLQLYVDGTHYYTVPVLIKSVAIKAAVAGLVEVSYDCQRDGDDSYT